jgi:hypothetical protein
VIKAWVMCNMLYATLFTVRGLGTLAQTLCWGTPLVGCPQLLNEYIRSYAKHMEAVS